MTAMNPSHDVQHLCRLAGLPRATYYRYVAAADDEGLDHDMQDAIQHICLKHRYYGYRRVTAMLRRQGHVAQAGPCRKCQENSEAYARRQPAGHAPKALPCPAIW